jgi:hypothetical protein
MLRFNNNKIVNHRSFFNKFLLEGRNDELISRANSQQFKYIDGAGEGGFLVYENHAPSGKFTTLTLSSSTTTVDHQLIVKDIYVFNIQNSNPVVFVKTVELKAYLEDYHSRKNFNIIDQKSVLGEEGYIAGQEGTVKTFKEIVEESVPNVEVVFTSMSIPVPYNFVIQGKNFLEITDSYCKAYGLIWTMYSQALSSSSSSASSSSASDGDMFILHIFSLDELAPAPISVSDINYVRSPRNYEFVRSIHPVIDCCLKSTHYWKSKENASSGIKPREIYCPYYPAILEPDTTEPDFMGLNPTVTNETQVNACSNFIKTNLDAYSQLENHYYVNYYINPILPELPPQCLQITYAHNGQGYRTSFFSGRYEGLQIPIYQTLDKQARNVIGELTYEYKKVESDISHFFVTPLYGLDGWIDLEQALYVRNLYKWDYGAEGAKIRIEWDCNNLEWIPLQQEYVCPPEGVAIPLPEPSDDPPKIVFDWEE